MFLCTSKSHPLLLSSAVRAEETERYLTTPHVENPDLKGLRSGKRPSGPCPALAAPHFALPSPAILRHPVLISHRKTPGRNILGTLTFCWPTHPAPSEDACGPGCGWGCGRCASEMLSPNQTLGSTLGAAHTINPLNLMPAV